MFSVKWVIHPNEGEPVEVEDSPFEDLNAVVSSALHRIDVVRLRHPNTPPNGFIVLDREGKEVHRWFRSIRL